MLSVSVDCDIDSVPSSLDAESCVRFLFMDFLVAYPESCICFADPAAAVGGDLMRDFFAELLEELCVFEELCVL